MIHLTELTINWHILEQCNYNCYFCYAKYGQPSGFRDIYHRVLHEVASLRNARIELRPDTVRAASIRINFAGGEPFLEKRLGPAIVVAHELGLKPSFISNGALIEDDFIREYGSMISVAGFSIDSFVPETNRRIGRTDKRDRQVGFERLAQIFALFRENAPATTLKINTVVCRENKDEDLTAPLTALAPDRWKALQVIPIHGGSGRGISDEQFRAFGERHASVPGRQVFEDNREMHRSYVMLDPDACFYQREGSEYLRSASLREIGALEALKGVEFSARDYQVRY